MTSATRVPPAEITGLFGALVKRMTRRKFGRTPDSLGVMWNHPTVLKDLMGFNRTADTWHELGPELSSYARMATAAAVGCDACLDINYFKAHDEGLDEAKAREVPRWRESDVFTPTERRVMAYAEAMSQTPPAVTDAMSAELLEELGAPALIELTAKVGLMNTATRMNVTLGIHSDGLAATCGLPPIAPRSAEVGSPA